MLLVGLTGGIATGKSTVAGIFTKDMKVPVIDADAIAREVVEKGTPGYTEVVQAFGDNILDEEGRIDRPALRQLVFSDEGSRRKLERITHPRIQREIMVKVCWSFLKGHTYVILDIPLLFEAGAFWRKWLYAIVVVTCEEDLQMQRLMENRGLGEAESKAIIDAQMPNERKVEMADFVVENSSSLADANSRVREIHSEICSSGAHWRIRAYVGAVVVGLTAVSIAIVNTVVGRLVSLGS